MGRDAIGQHAWRATSPGAESQPGGSSLDVRLLGPVEVHADNASLPVARPVWRAVLAVLALRVGQPCSAEHLIDALWGDDPPEKARSVLQSHVARLRRCVEPERPARAPGEILVTVPGGYLLNLGQLNVDAERFAQYVERGLGAADDGDADAALDALDAAANLWRGEPFPEVGRTAYAVAERARLEELRRTATTVRLECLLTVGRDAEAVAEAEALVHDHPLHEPLWAVLAVGHYRLGGQAAALTDLGRLHDRLEEDLGLDPSPEIRELERALLNQVDWLEGPWPLRPGRRHELPVRETRMVQPLPEVLAVRVRSPFVGRDGERERILAAVDDAAAGERRIVLLAGEPGIGKSRLAIEVAHEIRARRGVVLAGGCDEQLGVPYRPFAEALAAYASANDLEHLRGALGPRAAYLGRLLPQLLELPGVELPPSVDPDTDRFQLFEAVAGWLRAVGERIPSLLIIDDLHWATPETLLLLRHLGRVAHLPVALLGTYRSTDVEPGSAWREVLAELRTWPGVEHLTLAGLRIDEVAAMLDQSGDGESAARHRSRAAALHRVTAGNPFFVEELVAHLGERDRGDDEPHHGATDGLPPDLVRFDGVQDVVARRLSGLAPGSIEVLRIAAIAGATWDVATLVAATGDEETVLRAVEEATGAALLREARDDAVYSFAHALVRQVLVAQLTAARQQHEHLRVADALEQVHGTSRAGVVAEHLRQAGNLVDIDRMVAASLAAAGQAWQQAAFEEAVDHCQDAIELLDRRGGDPAHVARLRQMLGETLYATQLDSDRGLEQLTTARELFEEVGDRHAAAVVRVGIARFLTTFFGRLDVVRARRELDAALEVLEPEGPSPALAEALTILAAAAGWDLRADVGREAGVRALELSRGFEDTSARLTAQALAGLSLLIDGQLAEGQQLMADGHAEAVDRGEPLAIWITAYTYALSGNLLQDPSGWYGWVEEELATGRYEHAAGLRTALIDLLAGWSVARGRPVDARRHEEEFAGRAPSSPWKWLDLEGRWEEAAQAGLDAAAVTLATDDRNSGTVALWWASRARELQGREDDAVRLIERAVELLPAHPPAWATLWMRGRAAVLLAGRDRERALIHLDACERVLSGGEDHRGLEGLVALARAATASTLTEADRAFDEARAAYRRVDHRLFEIDVLWRWGAASGRPEHLDAAAELSQVSGLGEPWRVHIDAVRQAASGG